MAASQAALRGYLLEEALAWLLRNTGYELLVDASQDGEELVQGPAGLCVRGRGTNHQVDVLGEFAFTPAFSLPIRLFLEAKFVRNQCRLSVVRNAYGVIHDINENFVHAKDGRPRKRYQYVYALFSASGFTPNAQDFALAQQISLVDLSGTSFEWLRSGIEQVAADLDALQAQLYDHPFPVRWMRSVLRSELRTMPDLDGAPYRPRRPAEQFAAAADSVLSGFAARLRSRVGSELLLGFPAAPFILPLATDNAESFLEYVRDQPDHPIRLRRLGQRQRAEWLLSPAEQPDGYQLTFTLPAGLEGWIVEQEEERVSRTRVIKRHFLSEIIIYRMAGDNLQTYQLHYEPSDLRRQ